MEKIEQTPLPWYRSDRLLPAGLAIFVFLLHLPVLTRYGYHHDELYFIACGNHLAWGYVDHAPLVPWIARLMTSLFGESLFVLRILAAASIALSVFLAGMLARKLGGGRFAQALACLGMIAAPVFLRIGNMLCLPAFEPLFWLMASILVVCIIQEENPHLWILVGLVVGVGLLNKHSMAFFGFGLVVGMLLTPLRKHFKSPWLYAGGALALLIILPNLLWQARNGWPTIHFILNLKEGVMSGISALQFLAGQLLYLGPFNAALWIPGLVFFMRSKSGKKYRILGLIWIAVFLLLLATKSKIYYLAPAYAALFAGGGMALENWAREKARRGLKTALAAFLLGGGILLAPLSLPVLDFPATEKYARAVTFGAFGNISEITTDMKSMFSWEKKLAAVAAAYHSLTPAEKEKALIWAFGYGNAGAVDHFGGKHGLPKAVSLSNSYWLWGVPEGRGDVVVAMGIEKKNIERAFKKVDVFSEVALDPVLPWEKPFMILICRQPVIPLPDIWLKNRPW
jgi:hypothetical protein